MKFAFFLLFLSAFNFAFSAEEKELFTKNSEYNVDWKYLAGEYLIYDCERQHYVCVNVTGNENCEEERKYAIEKKLEIYPCAPLQKFADKKSCVLKDYEVVDRMAARRFCYPK